VRPGSRFFPPLRPPRVLPPFGRLLSPLGYPLGCAELLGATWGLTLLCHRAKRGWQQRVCPRVALRWANHQSYTVANKLPHAAPSLPRFGCFAASFPSLRCLLSVASLPPFRRFAASFRSLRCLVSVATLPRFRRFAASFPLLRGVRPPVAILASLGGTLGQTPAASCCFLSPPGYPLGCAELLGATWGLTLLCHRAKRGWQQRV